MGEEIMLWMFEKVMPWLAIVAIAGIVIAIPISGYYFWKESSSPVLTLKKSEWSCTNSQVVPETIYVQSGKVMLPVTTYSRTCNQWTRQ